MKTYRNSIFAPLMTLLLTVLPLGIASQNSVALAATNFSQDASCRLALKMDDASSSLLSMCGNNNGTATGATANMIGQYNKAYRFDGNDYVRGNSSLGINGNSLTVAFWANIDLQNWQTHATFVVEPYDSGSAWDWPFVNFKISRSGTSTKASFHYTTSHTLYFAESTDNFFQSGFHHYAFVKNNNIIKFYRDGVQVGADVTVPSGNLTGSSKWYLGVRADYDLGEYANATMDEVGVFSRALSTSEIVSIKDNGLDGQQSTTPPETCETDYTLCTTQTACTNAGYYWYNNQCNATAQQSGGSGGGSGSAGNPGYDVFFVRPGGGTSTQCNGLTDADYPGSGTNQNCAFNHPNWALPMAQQPVPALFQGGDTMIIYPGNYEFGVNAPNHPQTSTCHWSFPYACTGLGPIPSGTAEAPTKILGAEWNSGCNNPPQLWGSERVGYILSLENSNNIELRCLDITDHSDCIENQGSAGCNKSSYPYGNWASVGVVARDSNNVLMEKVKIHGMAYKGIHAGRISNYELRDSVIRGNGFVGWDGDLGSGINSSNSGYIKFIRTTVEYNGCAENYPPSATSGHVGISKCWSQGQGGYGDGIGTHVTDGDWYFEDANISHNVSDGIDLLYAGTQGSLTIVRGTYEGNAGNQIKSGFDTDIEDAKIIGNCAYFTAFGNTGLVWNGGTSGIPWDGNCRALGNTIAFDIKKFGQKMEITSSTITGQGDVLLQSSGTVCNGSESIVSKNNIWVGGKEYFHYGDTGFYYAAGATGNGDGACGNLQINNQDSIVYKVKTSPCPQATIMCVDPLFAGITITTEMVPQNIHNYNVNLSPLSPAVNMGNMLPEHDIFDNNMFDRGLVWDFGAFELSINNCGNGTVEGGESCDEGALNGQPGHCNSQCNGTVPGAASCGNGIIEGSEACDSSSNSCTTSGGYAGTQVCNSSCTGFTACTSNAQCGDQIINGSEVCDSDLQICTTTAGYSGTMVCNTACSAYQACTSDLYCGDAIINGPEVCDGSSLSCVTASGYAGTQNCNSTCSGLGSCTSTQSCGDNQVNGPEVCDGGSTSCTTTDGYAGVKNCNTSCSGYSSCTSNLFCGDNVVSAPEICDGNITSCTTSSGYAGTRSCNTSCSGFGTCNSDLYCGDNQVNGTEVCDGGFTSCTTSNGYPGVKNCNSSCSDYGSCTSTMYCGDNQVNGIEVCDGNTTSCTTSNGYAGTRSCNSSCSAFDSSCTPTQYCGDGTANGNEQCDDNNNISGDGCSASCQIESTNNPPTMLYVKNLYGIWIKWKGYDSENGYNIQYSYKVGNSAWTNPSNTTQRSVSQLKNQFNLNNGYHTIYVKSIDQNGSQSQPKSVNFYVY